MGECHSKQQILIVLQQLPSNHFFITHPKYFIFLFHVYKGGTSIFSSPEKFSHGLLKDHPVQIYTLDAFNTNSPIINIFEHTLPKHLLPAVSKALISSL
jgi:hypothetical protein